jgi:AhpD family alkylhydroperoxidase
MQARMTHPVTVLPDAMKALLALSRAAESGTVPGTTHKLIHLRVSQINGCSLCVDMHARELKDAGADDERIWGVGAWRESPYFSDAERAALALAESVTRLADRTDAVLRRRVGRRRRPLRREGALVAAGVDRGDQRLEPAQRRCSAARRLSLVRRVRHPAGARPRRHRSGPPSPAPAPVVVGPGVPSGASGVALVQ